MSKYGSKMNLIGKGFSFVIMLSMILSFVSPGIATAAVPQEPAAQSEPVSVEQLVRDEIATNGSTDFFVWMKEKADLSPAYALQTKEEKGQFVFDTLTATAERTQKELRAYLDSRGIKYQAFYISNKILVQGGDTVLVESLAARLDVSKITANHKYQLDEPMIDESAPDGPSAIETSLTFINADDVWALGIDGDNIVVAGNDTGLDWDHPALINQYRGWDGSVADHNFNWWDATGSYPTVPGDGHGHGTHTSGTMVGYDGGTNQIGVAPGATLLHCKNMTDGGSGSDATFSECFEWDLAPWDLSGNNANPALAPDAINNSWGYGGGGQPQFQDEIAALQAAGILVEVSAGNEGSSCGTLRSPGDYEAVLTTGSIQHSSGTMPGTITGFSSRGPSAIEGGYYPDVMAPGENIRSSVPGGGYEGGWSGTSMAGPHVTGLIALMWQAGPALRGDVATTNQIIKDTAVRLTGQNGSNCGGDYTDGPNNDWGYGTIDALAAVQAAQAFAGGELEGTVTDSSTTLPIEDATISATDGVNTYNASSLADGTYHFNLPEGTFDVTFSAFGYLPVVEEDVVIVEDMVTTLDAALEPAESYVVSGFVSDGTTGWPLYAELSITDFPGGSIWNDPDDGYYSVTLPGGIDYTFTADAWAGGYIPDSQNTGILTGDLELNFELEVDPAACSAPGYAPSFDWFENFEAGDGGFTVSGTTSWAFGTPTSGPGEAHSGNNVWATNLSGNYGISEDGYVTSPNIDLSAYAGQGILVSWWQYLVSESNYDYASVEVSNDGGATWTLIYGPISGSIDDAWTNVIETLDPSYAVANFQIRFHFTTDSSVTYPGWYIDDLGLLAIDPPPPPTEFLAQDFEANNGGFMVSGTTSFAWGAPTSGPGAAHSGVNVWATNLAGSYNNSENGYTGSPAYDLSIAAGDSIILRWWQYLNRETCCDDAFVDVSKDNGATWTNVYESSVNELTWTQHEVVLDPTYATSGFQVRFRFTSDGSVVYDGWYVDDLWIGYTDASGSTVQCLPGDGGIVYGNVYDGNTDLPLNGALVTADTGAIATTVATPDEVVDDGFYMIFVETPAEHDLTASMDKYADQTIAVMVPDWDVVEQNFYLEAGSLSVAPTSLSTELNLNETETQQLTITNDGGSDAAFEIGEMDGGFTPGTLNIPTYSGKSVIDSAPQSIGRAPNAPQVSSGEVAAWLNSVLAGEPAFAVDLLTDALAYIPDTTAPGTWSVIGATQPSLFAGDFLNGDFSTLFAVSYDDSNLYTIDVATGAATLVGPTQPGAGATFSGLTGAPDGTLYGLATECNVDSTLSTIDPETGATTVVGLLNGVTCGIDLAYSTADGMIYVVDLITDSLFRVDPDTAETTLVGSLGVAANYAQGMDYEEETGILYWAAYTASGELRVIDTSTGASTLVGGFPGGTEVDSLAFTTGGAGDVLWLTEDPITGTVPAGGSVVVDVTFDSGMVTEYGEYLADLVIKNDTPYGKLTVPVTMTVVPDASFGTLEGTVTTTGYCDENPGPVEGAVVTITDVDSNTWTRTTAADGTYTIFLAEDGSPYTVAVAIDGYESGSETGVIIVGDETTTVDFDLRLLAPCVTAAPMSFDVDLALGTSLTTQLTLFNDGGAAADFGISEIPDTAMNPLEDLILDGGFEGGTPSSYWTEYSLNYGTPLCDLTGCGDGGGTAGPNTGAWWAWFGGFSGYEEGSVDQNVTIPVGTAFLDFYLWYGNYGDDTDYLAVEIDGTEVWRVTGADAGDYPVYTLVSLDISAFADGNSHNVMFYSENFSSAGSNIHVDDVTLESTPYTDVPWLAEDPTEGTVAADSTFDVDITFTALPTLTVGTTYYASVLVDTGDPMNPQIEVPVAMTIVDEAEYGVEVSPDQALTGAAGETLEFTVVVTNTGNVSDNFTIELGAHDYDATLSATSITLGAGASGTFTVSVVLPAGGIPASDVIPVIVTSTGDDSVTATTNLTATITGGGSYMLYLPVVNREFMP